LQAHSGFNNGDQTFEVTMAVSSLRLAASVLLAITLSACGGSSGGGGEPPITDLPASRAAAARFLGQATFGTTEAEVDRLMSLGYSRWIDNQFTQPVFNHQAAWLALDAKVKATDPMANAGQNGVTYAFWKAAGAGEDQLRQRVAFAWSQIMVVSMQDSTVGDQPRAVAAYVDMLADKGLGNYRDLLEGVSRHPLMGRYLSHLRNQKADTRSGRVPDENYAREVVQLFSIGLHELNADGTQKQTGGNPIDTYTQDDIAGLARVFTGWSYSCPAGFTSACFYSGGASGEQDPDRWIKPMVGYAQFHSTEEKRFLGRTIAAQSSANPDASLKDALDTLAAHPNVGPFIGKQLIQRLVTSNPSPAYVAAVSAAFNANAQGVRGDLKHVVKTILTHPEALATSDRSGKVREPVLRMTALLRAYGYSSDSGDWRVGNTDNPGTSLGQTPMRSPSVFNFYRPGYLAPGTAAATAGLVTPEMQIQHETSAAAYVNTVRDAVSLGFGNSAGTPSRRDLQPNFTAELALADRPSELVASVNRKLMAGAMPQALATEIEGAVTSITVPALNSSGSNQADIDRAKRNRVNAAVFLAAVSPEFMVQK
jgi:uncharacterized protein (DUF1800 family)